MSAATITAEQAEKLSHELGEVVLMLKSIHELAFVGADQLSEDTVFSSIETLAKIALQKVDTVNVDLGGQRAGNFDEEFERMGPQRRTK
jgi:hypothetical protein